MSLLPCLDLRPGLVPEADAIAALAHAALLDELDTWPKPGLVSPVDSGSHTDMDAGTLRRSADALRPFFSALAEAGARDTGMDGLRGIGLDAEAAMMRATGGINAHRGAVFSLGLIAAAAGRCSGTTAAAEGLARAVGARWGEAILSPPPSPASHGGRAALRYGVGGARAEAAAGFPTLRRVGLPALRDGRRHSSDDPHAPRVHCLFALMADLDDTNLIHRGGLDGLLFAQETARAFMARGGTAASGWQTRAEAAHRAFVTRRLSPGGAADLLAATLFLDALERRR